MGELFAVHGRPNCGVYCRGRARLPAVPKKLIKRPALAAVVRYPAKIRDEPKSTGTLLDAQQILHQLDSSEYIRHAALVTFVPNAMIREAPFPIFSSWSPSLS